MEWYLVVALAQIVVLPGVITYLRSCKETSCVYGVCIEKHGNLTDNLTEYKCYCENGFTGLHCEVNYDECAVNPCFNQALCSDGVASFTCDCLPGFQGSLCEQNVDECASNPCRNDGKCVDEVNSYECQCKPGYTGDYCEVDVSVCNSTFFNPTSKQCANGGKCIDGPGLEYFCICNPGFQGTNCDKDVDECLSNPCNNGAECLNLLNDFKCFCHSGWAGKKCDLRIKTCEEETHPCRNDGLCLRAINEFDQDDFNVVIHLPSAITLTEIDYLSSDNDNYICYCVPDYYGKLCQFKYDDCLPEPKCNENELCVDGVNTYCCQPRNETGYCYNSLSVIPSSSINHYSPSITPTIYYSTDSLKSTVADSISPSLPPYSNSLPLSTLSTPVTGSDGINSLEISQTATSDDFIQSTQSISTLSESHTLQYFSTITQLYSSTFTYKVSSPSSVMPDSSTVNSMSATIIPSMSQLNSEEVSLPTDIPTDITVATSSPSISTTPSMNNSSVHISTNLSTLNSETITTLSLSSDTTVPTSAETTPFFIQTSPISPSVHSTISPSPPTMDPCLSQPCYNNGKCIYLSPELFRCDCTFQFSGTTCQDEVSLDIPFFSGNSYLSYNITQDANTENLFIEMEIDAKHEEGIIMLLTSGTSKSPVEHLQEFHILLELHLGFLSLKFSCRNDQQIALTDKHKISTYDTISLSIRFYFHRNNSGDTNTCAAIFDVNNSSSPMYGSQEIDTFEYSSFYVYLGGINHLDFGRAFTVQKQQILEKPGLVGCISGMKVNGRSIDLVGDATSGYNIHECGQKFCDTVPCQNGGSCIKDGTSWYCDCMKGFGGPLCERETCAHNSCGNGGTCVALPYKVGFMCLCSYGFKGTNCETATTVNVAGFMGNTGLGYSAYISYPRPPYITSYFELKITFKTWNIMQDAILFFVGPQTILSNRDYFALGLYNQRVALQFNLGSGPTLLLSIDRVTMNQTTTVYAGCHLRNGWLSTGGYKNVTGKSPGKSQQLNVESDVFFGGHPGRWLNLQPVTLFSEGFQGCILHMSFRNNPHQDFDKFGKVESGRNICECQDVNCIHGSCYCT